MRCINKFFTVIVLICIQSFVLCGCNSKTYSMAYERDNEFAGYNLMNAQTEYTVESFASDLCIAPANINTNSVDMSQAGAAGLFDLKKCDTLYAKNVNAQMHPASLTKIMTALVALKNSSSDLMLTATDNVVVTESGAQLCGIKPGDRMTLEQALHILLIYSANDVAIMIAEGVAGSEEAFCDMMNRQALELGATNSHFSNSNGLTADEHYTSPYDMYLILNEALKYELFNEIIHMNNYETIYYDSNGAEKKFSCESTNLYLKGTYSMPDGITVIGGKTGTTSAAGHCLILYNKDTLGNPYISVIMNSESRDVLYSEMTNLLMQINQK